MNNSLSRILAPWVRVSLHPADIGARLRGGATPLCYVLEHGSAADLAVLQQVCQREHLPRPGGRVLAQQPGERRAWFALTHRVGLWRTRLDRRPPELCCS